MWKYKNLQIGDNDLIGNKFNGHDLHLYLREAKINSSHLVYNKESSDDTTYVIGSDKPQKQYFRDAINDIKQQYSLDNIIGVDAYDVMYNKLFLEADVVHYHLIHNLNFDIQLLPLLSRIKPTVWTLHDPWTVSGHCIHHYKCDKWKNGCGDCPLLSVPFQMANDNTALNYELKRLAIENSQLDIIVASKWLERQVKVSPMFKNAKVHFVPFGINHKVFDKSDKQIIREKLGIPQDAIVLMARCDYSGFKGFDFVEYALTKIKTSKQIVLLLVGDKIKEQIPGIIIKEFGWVKEDSMLANIYNASDIFLMPSKVDTFGMMAIEAMSCGVLPIVLEGTSLPETIDAPRIGVSVPRDKVEFLKTVNYYIDNIKEREQRAKAGYLFARKTYSIDEYIKNILNVYDQAIARHKKDTRAKLVEDQLKKYMQIELDGNRNQSENIEEKHNIKESVIYQIKHQILKVIKITPEYKKLEKIEKTLNKNLDTLNKIEKTLQQMQDDNSKL